MKTSSEAVTLPIVENVEQLENQVVLTLYVPADLAYFEGHFPDFPVLPGVVQTHWAIGYGVQYFQQPMKIKKLEVIKFQNLIQPEARLSLTLVLGVNGKLSFSYQCGEQVMSSGRIVYPEGV